MPNFKAISQKGFFYFLFELGIEDETEKAVGKAWTYTSKYGQTKIRHR